MTNFVETNQNQGNCEEVNFKIAKTISNRIQFVYE